MRKSSILLLGALLLANGLYMLADAADWYRLVPTVPATGPFNGHFVRDIGCAYITAAAGLLWLARDVRAWPAALAGGAFLGLHAATHVWDLAAGRESPQHFAIDAVLVIAPALWALWLAWPGVRQGA